MGKRKVKSVVLEKAVCPVCRGRCMIPNKPGSKTFIGMSVCPECQGTGCVLERSKSRAERLAKVRAQARREFSIGIKMLKRLARDRKQAKGRKEPKR